MLWTILVILGVLWLLGMVGNVGGGLIQFFLVLALMVLVIKFLISRRPVL